MRRNAAAAPPATEASLNLESSLMEHSRVVRGQLRNGLRYTILPNAAPAGRFEAHLEMHVGSCEEADDEQGLAHLVEHVTFMGSRKRERLFSTGSKSNAYTDFHHTVYHFHCPVLDASGRQLLPLALDALREIAFEPELLGSRIEKERKAILSELQMINTIEYRCSTMHLRELHADNPLAERFPIGREDQILGWDATHVRAFHATHYHPDVADLYVVGDVDPSQCEKLVAEIFRSARARPRNLQALRRVERRDKPQVVHTWTLGGAAGAPVVPPRMPTIFKHELLQSFSLTVFAKEPLARRTSVSDLADFLTDRIVACCVARRLNKRERPNPPFSGVEFDFSDAPSEGCVVSTFIVYADAASWEPAVQRALQELHVLAAHGLAAAEVGAMKRAILADSRLRAQQSWAASVEQLALLMEADALGHTFTEPSHYDLALHLAAEAVDEERVNRRLCDLVAHIVQFGEAGAPAPAATVVCMPTPGGDGVVADPALGAKVLELLRSRAAHAPSAGEVATPTALVSEEDVEARARAQPPAWVEVKTVGAYEVEEVSPDSIQAWPEAEGRRGDADKTTAPASSGVVGAIPAGARVGDVLMEVEGEDLPAMSLRRLSNGMAINLVRSTAEPDAVALRLSAPGGRAADDAERPGALLLATATMLQGGSVGAYSREQVEMFCICHLIELNMEVTEECVRWDVHCPVGEGSAGLAAALQVMHALLTDFRWDSCTLDHTRSLFAAQHDARCKSLELAATHALMNAVWGGDERFLEPSPELLARLELADLEAVLARHLATPNLELTIVGDFDPTVVDELVLRYMGTLPPPGDSSSCPRTSLGSETPAGAAVGVPIPPRICPAPDRSLALQRMSLADSEPRAVAYIWGACATRFGTGAPADARLPKPVPGSALCGHPLRVAVALELLTEVINSRLFSVLRDMLGLVYESCVRFADLELLPSNGLVVTISAAPGKVDAAHDAALGVLRDLHSGRQPPTSYDLNKARRAVLANYASHVKDNAWLLTRMQHVQARALPEKDLRCVTEYAHAVEAVTVDDLRAVCATLGVTDGEVLSVIMASEPPSGVAGG